MEISDLIISDAALNLIDGGTWMGDFDDAPGVELLVTGLQSEAAQKALRAKQADLRKKNRGKIISEEQSSRITKEVLVEVVLKDWRGLKSSGEDVPYSKEMAQKWLLSRNGEKFVGLVLSAAYRLDAQASDLAKELEKN